MHSTEIEKKLDNCRDIIAGRLPLLTDQIELIAVSLVYKLMDDLDAAAEAAHQPKTHFVGPLAAHSWRGVIEKEKANERAGAFAAGINYLGREEKTTKLPAVFRAILKNAMLKFRDDAVLVRFIDVINSIQPASESGLGAAFEHLLHELINREDLGEFYTPRHIVDFVVNCMNPKPGESVLDPCCGTGGFLLSAARHVVAAAGKEVAGVGARAKLFANIRGYDSNELMVKFTHANLLFNGFEGAATSRCNVLTNDKIWYDHADVLLACAPFTSPRGGTMAHNFFRIPSRKSDVLFGEFINENMGPDGRAAIIVPNGVVANVQAVYTSLRRFLVEESLVAVVGLPCGVFRPYSGIKTSILFLDKKAARYSDDVLFAQVEHDGFDLGTRRSPMPMHNDLPAIQKVVAAWIARRDVLNSKKDSASGGEENQRAGQGWRLVKRRHLLTRFDVNLSVERNDEIPEPPQTTERAYLRDVSTVASGGTPSRSEPSYWENGDTRWLSSKDIGADHGIGAGKLVTEEGIRVSASRIVKPGSLLLATRVSTGRWAVTDSSVAINQDITCITADEKHLLPEFLHVLAPRLARLIDENAVGVNVRGVTRAFINALEIPLPPLEQQHIIAKRVAALRKVYDGARQILRDYRPTFDLPEDTPIVSYGDIGDLEYGFPAETCEDGDARFLRITDIDERGRLAPSPQRRVKLDKVTSRFRVKKGDIFIGRVGTSAGRTLLIEDNEPAIFASYLMRFKFSKKILPMFFWYFAQTENFWEQRNRLLSGGYQPQLNAICLRQLQVPLPEIEKQREILSKLEAEEKRFEVVRQIACDYEEKICKIADDLWGKHAMKVKVDANEVAAETAAAGTTSDDDEVEFIVKNETATESTADAAG